MGSDQIAEIAPGVREALAGGASLCVTFEVTGDPGRWVQFTAGTINAAYPHSDAPGLRLAGLEALAVKEWEPNKCVTGTLALEDAKSIAGWIDRYFLEVLDCASDYSVDLAFDRFGETRMLHPDYPTVDGALSITDSWAIVLPEKFNRRLDKGDLVIWRPGFTIRIATWNNAPNETAQQTLSWIKEGISAEAYDREEREQQGVSWVCYRLAEQSDDARVAALYCYAVAPREHLQMAFYFDDEADLGLAKAVWSGLQWTGPSGLLAGEAKWRQ